jgi:magnesium-protoporphyrin O-methyltransferase
MLEQARAWLREWEHPPGATLLDAGCGTGLATVALAHQGFHVTGVDIAPQMVQRARAQAQAAGVAERTRFVAGDIEVVAGTFDAVVCFDVLIHYPRPAFAQLAEWLARRCRGPLIITYAPYNRLLAMKHWVGGHFPQSERRTTIEMIPDTFVQQTLASGGMRVHRSQRISCGFYHVVLLEAHPSS